MKAKQLSIISSIFLLIHFCITISNLIGQVGAGKLLTIWDIVYFLVYILIIITYLFNLPIKFRILGFILFSLLSIFGLLSLITSVFKFGEYLAFPVFVSFIVSHLINIAINLSTSLALVIFNQDKAKGITFYIIPITIAIFGLAWYVLINSGLYKLVTGFSRITSIMEILIALLLLGFQVSSYFWLKQEAIESTLQNNGN